jgi:inosine-uridine nucleoside N-ribohydrolase
MKNQIRVVLDTDTYNEIDDQFALSYLVRSEGEIKVEAIYAAPFTNSRSSSAKEGMEKSYDEIDKLLTRLNRLDIPFYKGASYYLTDKNEAEKNDAVLDLIQRAKSATPENPIYIIAIGAITNVAAAYLLNSEVMINNCIVIWLGGNHPSWPHNKEFNFLGDVKAVQIVFDSKMKLVLVPCLGVSSHLTSSREELATYMDLKDPLCNFLYQRFSDYIPEGMGTKEIWDIAAVAVIILPKSFKSVSISCPRVAEDGSYIMDPRRHKIELVYWLNRDEIYRDLYNKLLPESK